MLIDGISLPFVTQTSLPKGYSSGTFAGSQYYQPVDSEGDIGPITTRGPQFGPRARSCPRKLPWAEEFMTQGPISEDCLFLNLWTTAKSTSGKQAVMAFIYGGGFCEGSGSVAVYKGAALARKGVVVVTLNFRVGPLGFLVYPDLTKESEQPALIERPLQHRSLAR